jgi:hypothetical protein
MIGSEHLNPGNWILDRRIDLSNTADSGSIDPVRGTTDAAAIGVGISSRDADPDWSLGAYLHCIAPVSIGSYPGLSFFNASLLLGCITFVSHPAPTLISPSIEWRLSFPRWLYSVEIEVWRFLSP